MLSGVEPSNGKHLNELSLASLNHCWLDVAVHEYATVTNSPAPHSPEGCQGEQKFREESGPHSVRGLNPGV